MRDSRRYTLKSAIFATFGPPWRRPWPSITSYGILSCITHWPLSTQQISTKSEKKTLRTDGRTVTDIEIGFIRDRLEECTVDLIIRLKSNGRSRRSATQSREGRITCMSENEFVAVSQEQWKRTIFRRIWQASEEQVSRIWVEMGTGSYSDMPLSMKEFYAMLKSNLA